MLVWVKMYLISRGMEIKVSALHIDGWIQTLIGLGFYRALMFRENVWQLMHGQKESDLESAY